MPRILVLPACLIILLATEPAPAASLNTPAPNFSLLNSHQQKRTLADYKGKVTLINFWASWCGPCQEELPGLNRLAAHYTGQDVRVVAINVDQESEEGRKALARLGLNHAAFEVLWDARSKAVSTYNIETMPASFILDAQGVIRYIHSGFHPQDPSDWRKEINSFLK